MKTQAAVLLASFIGLLGVINSQESGQVYCGRQLSYALAILCENGLIKRSETSFVALEDHGLPWIPVHRAKAMDRGKRQIVSECCDKPCTMDELQAYCAE